MIGQLRRPRAAPGGTRTGTADPGRVLRRRRGPLQLALGGVLVVLILVVEVLILQAYVNISRTTAIFKDESYVAGALVKYRKALEIDPQDTRAHTSVGCALYDQKDLPGATAALVKATRQPGVPGQRGTGAAIPTGAGTLRSRLRRRRVSRRP